MNQVQAALSKKYGPFPGIVWAGLIGVAGWLLLPRLRGSTAAKPATSTAAAAGTQATTDYSLGYSQGLQAAGTRRRPGGTPDTTTAAPAPPAGVPSLATFSAYVAQLSMDQRNELTHLGYSLTAPNPLTVQQVTELQHLGYNWHALQGHPGAAPPDLGASSAAGLGGGRAHARGGRSADLMAGHHPLMRAVPLRAHWVKAVGGPSNHHAEVARVARQAGLHPARLLALNPRATGFIRVA